MTSILAACDILKFCPAFKTIAASDFQAQEQRSRVFKLLNFTENSVVIRRAKDTFDPTQALSYLLKVLFAGRNEAFTKGSALRLTVHALW